MSLRHLTDMTPITETEQYMRGAGDPRASLMVLAQGIDKVLTRLAAVEAQLADRDQPDPWAEWAAAPAEPMVDDLPASSVVELQATLAAETDPDERRALEARLRLLKEEGGVVDGVPEGRRVVEAEFTPGNLRPTQAISVGANTVDLPVPTEEQRLARLYWALKRKLWDFIPLEQEQACEAFAKGGPMWLYLGNRDAVMAMPVEWRRELVEMVAEDSIAQSQELGADILKIADSPDRELYRGV